MFTFFVVKTRRKKCFSCSGQFLKKSCKQKPRAKHQFPSKTSSETPIFKQNLEQNSDFQVKPRAKHLFPTAKKSFLSEKHEQKRKNAKSLGKTKKKQKKTKKS